MSREAYCTDVVERDGYRFLVELEYDNDRECPWEDGDGNGIVEGPTNRDKHPGEVLLWNLGRYQKWYFNWQGTVKKAKDERWGMAPEYLAQWAEKLGRQPTKGEIAVVASQNEYDRFHAWLRNDWWYCGVIITLLTDDPDEDSSTSTDYGHSRWGIEDGYYKPKYGADYGECKSEVIEELIDTYLTELTKERDERQYWEARSVPTQSDKLPYGIPS